LDGDSTWLYVIFIVGALSTALVFLYVTRAGKKKKKERLEAKFEAEEKWPLKAERSVTPIEVEKAQNELRVLDLEREILSYAIRRLYEAEAEGKISEEERERLARKYKERMAEIKDMIARSESLVALHELESMQVDLVKLFSERFDDLNRKIEELRMRLQIKSVREAPIPSPVPVTISPAAAPVGEERKKRRLPPPVPRKSEAEERIEKIREEVEKVLERLGQIEAEA
jgi:hypothetical protein